MKSYLFILFISISVLFSCGDTIDKTDETTNSIDSTAQVSETTNDFEEQIKNINQKIKADLNNANLYADRASIFLKKKDLASASADLQRALSLDSNNYHVYIVLGDLQAAQGQFEPTKYAFLKAFQKAKTPKDKSVAYQKLGEVYYVIQDYVSAMEYADKALQEDMYNAETYYLKGLIFSATGNEKNAISSFQTAVEQNPEHIKAYMQLALIFEEKDSSLVLDYTNNILSINPNDVNALYTQAMYQQEHDMLNEAMENYTKITKIDPQMREAPFNIGYIHLVHLKLFKEAKKYFEQAIEIDPNYFEAYYNYGYCFELLGDIGNAEKIYKKALKIKPDYTAAAQGLNRINDTRTINE